MKCQRIKVHRDIDEFLCWNLKVKMYLNFRTLIRIQWSVLCQKCDNVLSPTYQLFVHSVLWSLGAVTRKEQNTWQIKSKDFHSCCRTDRCNVPFHLKPNYVLGHWDTYFWRHQCIMSDIIRTEMLKFQLWKNLWTESRDTWTKQLCDIPNLSPLPAFLIVHSSAHVKQGLHQKSFEVDDDLSAGLPTVWTSPVCFVFVTNPLAISWVLTEHMTTNNGTETTEPVWHCLLSSAVILRHISGGMSSARNAFAIPLPQKVFEEKNVEERHKCYLQNLNVVFICLLWI